MKFSSSEAGNLSSYSCMLGVQGGAEIGLTCLSRVGTLGTGLQISTYKINTAPVHYYYCGPISLLRPPFTFCGSKLCL